MSSFSQSNQPMELLAPAGDWEALRAGLAAGADAIYLGGRSFSARQSAANFDLAQLRDATELLHLKGRKIYVTVNTLLHQAELPEALEFLTELSNMGVDAVIVQDLGLINLARQHLPQLELHASTQMTIHNREGALALKELGIRRIVLARELTREEVAAIAAETGLELEVFIHGALCVCYSGQCLMSSMIGGRSGNRGRCAQPCRLEYQLLADGAAVPTQGSYLLSPKDLALAGFIPELARAGVRSLKIEGRMKRPEYVYGVTKVYRRLLDRFQEDPAAFQVSPADIEELEQAFNRGFSTGYFGGNRNAGIVNFTRPNNRGVYLGRVQTAQRESGRIGLKLEASLENGDEVEIWVSQGGRQAGPVRDLARQGQRVAAAVPGETVSFSLPGKIGPGDRVFKVYSQRLDRETTAATAENNPEHKIPLTAHLEGELAAPLRLTFQDELGNQGRAVSAVPLQAAKTRPLTPDIVAEQLGRLGNTPFRLTAVTTALAANGMAPLSELNQLRREALENLRQARLNAHAAGGERQKADWRAIQTALQPRDGRRAAHGPAGRSSILSAWVADLESVAAVAPHVEIIYAGGDELTGYHWNAALMAEALEIAHRHQARLVLGLPRINREEHRAVWHQMLQTALGVKPDGIMVSELGSFYAVSRQSGPDIYLNSTLNFFNSAAVGALGGSRIKQATLSPELSLRQIQAWCGNSGLPQLELLVQGPLELMVSEYCPSGTVLAPGKQGAAACGSPCRQRRFALRDRLNLDFPVYTDQFCRMHLFNSKELCLYGDLAEIGQLGPLTWRLELKLYPAQAAGAIAASYRHGLELWRAGEGPDDSAGVIEAIKQISGRGITKGHLFRGVE